MITLPVLLDNAEEPYHSIQSATNRIVSMPGILMVGTANGLGAGESTLRLMPGECADAWGLA